MQCQHKIMTRPKEDEVSLVVEGDSSPSLEIWILAEDGGKHTPKSMTQPSAKVVENQLWSVRACPAMMLHVSHPFVSYLTQVRSISLLECQRYSTAQHNATESALMRSITESGDVTSKPFKPGRLWWGMGCEPQLLGLVL